MRPAVAAALPALLLPAASAAAAPEDASTKELREALDAQRRRIEDLERRLGFAEQGSGSASPADLDAAVRRYVEERRSAAGDPGTPGGSPGDHEYLVGSVARPSSHDFHFGGYASFLYRSPEDAARTPSFEGYRVVPQFAFQVSPGIEFATEIEFEGGGAGAPYLTGNYIVIEYAEARFDVAESFVPRMGILLVPFLRYNASHDDPIWNLQDRPFTATRLFRAPLQQPGVGAEGTFPTDAGHSFNYNVAVTGGPDDGVTNAGFGDARQSFRTDNNDDKALWGRFGATPRLRFLDAADFGVSLARADMAASGTPSVDMNGYGFDAKVTKGRFDFIGEWCAFDYDRPASQPVATFPHGTSGGFLQVDTRLRRGFEKSENGIVGPSSELILAVRHEWADTNDRVRGASVQDDSRAWIVGLAFRFTPKTVVRIEHRWEWTTFDAAGPEELGMWVFSLSTYF